MSEMKSSETSLVDFSDSIGPMVVKELRQGLRTRAFTWAFVIVQALLLLFMMSGFSEYSDSRATAGSFWVLLQVTLLFVMPLRGLNALNSEVRLNTMELISLTRMSAWRITAGKWLALMSQSVLLAVAVLPYIVLRYFFGGMNVLAEIVLLFVVIGLSGLLTALMVGLSVVSNFLIRCFFTVPVVILTMQFMWASVDRVTRGDGVAPFHLGALGWAAIVPAAIFLGYYLLDMAASRIAPEAVNYVTRRRLAGFVAFLVALAIAHLQGISAYLFYPFFFFTLLALDALSEHPPTVPSVYAPFRRIPLGRVLENFLAPGWFSGMWFVLLLSVLFASAAVLLPDVWTNSGISSEGHGVSLILGFTASALLPLAIMLLTRPAHPQPIVSYCLIAIFMGTISATLIPFVERGEVPALAWLGMVLPPVSTYAALNDALDVEAVLLAEGIQVCVLLFSIAVVIWKWKRLRQGMKDWVL